MVRGWRGTDLALDALDEAGDVVAVVLDFVLLARLAVDKDVDLEAVSPHV